MSKKKEEQSKPKVIISGSPDVKIKQRKTKVKQPSRKLEHQDKVVTYKFQIKGRAKSSTGETVKVNNTANWQGYMPAGTGVKVINDMKRRLTGGDS